MRRTFQATLATLLAGIALFAASKASAAADAAPAKPASRAEAVALIAEARRIVTPAGIEREQKVRIGGIEQWISIRGNHRANPVLLVIHGGPGYTSMPLAWWNARTWEEFFTVVHWDQRAAGRTHLLTDPEVVAPTLTLDRMYADTEEVAAWVRGELARERIFVLGHSWGTYLGLRLALERPGWLHAYVGVAQITDMRENERRNWRVILDRAHRAGDADAVAALEALAPYAAPGAEVPMEHIYTQRRTGERLGGTLAHRDNNRAESAMVRLAPEYDDAGIGRAWDGNAFAAPYLFREIIDIDFSGERSFDVPMLMFLGRHDTIAHPGLVAEWFEGVEAPGKRLVWFEESAHSPMTEEPGRFLLSLVGELRPIAERAGDVPPPR
ncbi:alpha/beta fold hydrolase [Luteimonas viscosa]|nr:alpha/beta fold hydrolase [Luteimonas viscosa]